MHGYGEVRPTPRKHERMKLKAIPAMSTAQTLLIALLISATTFVRMSSRSAWKTGLLVPAITAATSVSGVPARTGRTFSMAMF